MALPLDNHRILEVPHTRGHGRNSRSQSDPRGRNFNRSCLVFSANLLMNSLLAWMDESISFSMSKFSLDDLKLNIIRFHTKTSLEFR